MATRISRRAWLAALAPQILAAQQHAHQAAQAGNAAGPLATALQVLDPAAAREIEALAARIIPTDDTPGAREAGVIYFIDRALATFARDKRTAYRNGLRQVQARRKELFPASTSIAALAAEQQDQLLGAIEKTGFFDLLRTHTVLGFFGPPGYGGNRNQVGWKLIGFEDRASFQPPFGYYDAEAGR